MPSDTAAEQLLLSNIRRRMPELKTLLKIRAARRAGSRGGRKAGVEQAKSVGL